MQLQRYTGTPIPKPRADHTWEARAVFNGAAVYHNRLCHMLYRAVAPNLVSTIGYDAVSHPWLQAVGWHLSGDPDAPEIVDYAAWPDVQEWDWTYEDGATTRMRGHLRTLEQIVNELMEAGFVLKRLVEQNIEDVAKASPEELARLPYVSKFDPASQEYQIMRKLPHTLIIRARKGALQYG